MSSMTDFIDDYCRWFKLPLPEPEEETEAAGDGASNPNANATGEAALAKKDKRGRWNKKSKGLNARERRKARRVAGKDGALAEDIDQEEREELIGSMAVSWDSELQRAKRMLTYRNFSTGSRLPSLLIASWRGSHSTRRIGQTRLGILKRVELF